MSKFFIILIAFTRLMAGYLDTVTYPGYTGPAPVYNSATGAWDNVSSKDSLRYSLYDLDGNITQRVDRRGTVTNYLYSDPENRLTDIQYPATTSLNVHFNYDAFGRRGNTTNGSPGMTDATGSAAYAYDDDDDLTSVVTTYTGLPAQTVSYQYYPDAARRTMTTPAGAVDGLGQQNEWRDDVDGLRHGQVRRRGQQDANDYCRAGGDGVRRHDHRHLRLRADR